MRRIFLSLTLTVLVLPAVVLSSLGFFSSATAGQRPVVVELFTSQGCSSCPPADRFLSRLAQRKDVIALELHVDYWDYLGWKDSFGSAKFSRRQRAYAAASRTRTVYTPQMVVQGVNQVVGSRVDEVQRLIMQQSEQTAPARISLSRAGNTLTIRAAARNGKALGPAVIHLVRFLPRQTVEVKAGENAGLRLDYTNVVTSWTTVGKWNGRGEITLTRPVQGQEPLAVLVQSKGPGPILAAQVLR